MTRRRSCGTGGLHRRGRKGSYIGMFAFTCDMVPIPIWITA